MDEPDSKIRIYFGDKNNFVSKADFQNSLKALSHAREYLGAQSLFLIDQVHGTDGFFVNEIFESIVPIREPLVLSLSKAQSDRLSLNIQELSLSVHDEPLEFIPKSVLGEPVESIRGATSILPLEIIANIDQNPFVLNKQSALKHTNTFLINKPADFLYTNLSGIALGILTADCLPIIVFDQAKKALLAIHTGWRGSLRGIIKIALQEFCKNLDLNLKDLLFYFGPSAQECCYEVGEDFILELSKTCENWQEFISKREEKLFFSLPKFNYSELINLGVLESSTSLENNECTICNPRFCSYRRSGDSSRNITIALIV